MWMWNKCSAPVVCYIWLRLVCRIVHFVFTKIDLSSIIGVCNWKTANFHPGLKLIISYGKEEHEWVGWSSTIKGKGWERDHLDCSLKHHYMSSWTVMDDYWFFLNQRKSLCQLTNRLSLPEAILNLIMIKELNNPLLNRNFIFMEILSHTECFLFHFCTSWMVVATGRRYKVANLAYSKSPMTLTFSVLRNMISLGSVKSIIQTELNKLVVCSLVVFWKCSFKWKSRKVKGKLDTK